MGTSIELNDTLLITEAHGFPVEVLNLTAHTANPVNLSTIKDRIFQFKNKAGARFFHLDPVRVFLVQNIDDKWLFWGKVYIQEQTISKDPDDQNKWVTSGSYRIIDLFEPDYQKNFTIRESMPGKSYF